MERKNIAVIVSAVGFLTAFISALMTAVNKRGGNDDDVYRLSLPEGQNLIDQIADIIVGAGKAVDERARKTFRVIGNFSSIAEGIKAGGYDKLFSSALSPEDIKGATVHSVDMHVKLAQLDQIVLIKELVAQLPSLVDLATLLAFGAQWPDVQREFPIATVWEDSEGQLWFAALDDNHQRRRLEIALDGPLFNSTDIASEWGGEMRFLVREETGSS